MQVWEQGRSDLLAQESAVGALSQAQAGGLHAPAAGSDSRMLQTPSLATGSACKPTACSRSGIKQPGDAAHAAIHFWGPFWALG